MSVGPQGSTAAQFKPGTSAVVSVTKDKPSNLHGVRGSPRQAALDEGKRSDFNQPRQACNPNTKGELDQDNVDLFSLWRARSAISEIS